MSGRPSGARAAHGEHASGDYLRATGPDLAMACPDGRRPRRALQLRLLDRLFGYTGAASSDDILPQFQDLDVGDVIPLGSGPSWPVIVADRNQALVVEPVAGAVSWAWILTTLDASTTRLISRVRVRIGHKPLLLAFAPAVDLPWFLMERKMLHGIKRRAERLAQTAEA